MHVQSSVAAAAATLGNLKLGDSKALAWNFENFVDGIKAHRGDLSWRAVVERLDVPGFSVADAHAFAQLVRPAASSRLPSPAAFPQLPSPAASGASHGASVPLEHPMEVPQT